MIIRMLLWCSVFMFIYSPAISALDDLPIYYDAWEEDGTGCERTGVDAEWYLGMDTAKALVTSEIFNSVKFLPLSCTEKYRGTDALDFELQNPVLEGGYYDVIIKFGDHKKHGLTGYQDLRFRVKNLNSTEENLRVVIQNMNFQNKPALNIAIAADADWSEIVIPLSSFDGLNADDSIWGAGFSWTWPDEKDGSELHLLIDDLRITDGTNSAITAVPSSGAGTVPSNWPSYLATGFLDNRNNPISSSGFNTKCDYRYQYVMPETFTSWDSLYVQKYANNSDTLGFKTAIVWYNFGKVSESEVATNLADASFMTDYFTRFETVLDQLISGGANQKDYVLILEPDMYGKLMQDAKLVNNDAASITVDMTKANELSGKTYASNLKGWAEYMVERSRTKLASKGVIIGHMLNHWGINIPRQIGQGRIEAHILGGYAQGDFLNSMGDVGKGDVVFVEKTDRDAGNPEKASQDWFWNEYNYDKYFSWVKCLSARSNLRVVGWQISEGNMNHSVEQYRDDAVQYFMDYPELWANAGFIGLFFGAGLVGNANYASGNEVSENDDGWFSQQMRTYAENRFALIPLSTRKVVQKTGVTRYSVTFKNGKLFFDKSITGKVKIFSLNGKRQLSSDVINGVASFDNSSGLYMIRIDNNSQTIRLAIP